MQLFKTLEVTKGNRKARIVTELVRIPATVKTKHLKYSTSINPDFLVILADTQNYF